MYGRVGVITMSKGSKYTVDDIPVKDINNGMIVLDNNQKVTGVKVLPRNIFITDYGTQSAIINNLKNVYNQIDYEFWLVVADRPVDINVYQSELQLLYNNTNSPVIRKMIMQDMNKANMFISNNVVDTEYFILFKEKDQELIGKRIRNLITSLANSGLNSHQVTNEDLRLILDNFLNAGQSSSFGTVIG